MTGARNNVSGAKKSRNRGHLLPDQLKKHATSAETDAWELRINKLFAEDCRTAEEILEARNFSAATALGFIKNVQTFGTILQLKNGAPPEFTDATDPCFYALRLLALRAMIEKSDPTSLQVGRLWGRFSLGLRLPEVAKAVRDGHLAQHRGPGGSSPRDLARTIEVLVSEEPQLDGVGLIAYLQGEEAADRFASTTNRTIFVTGVEYDETAGLVTYEDQKRETQSVKIGSLERKIRAVKKNLKS